MTTTRTFARRALVVQQGRHLARPPTTTATPCRRLRHEVPRRRFFFASSSKKCDGIRGATTTATTKQKKKIVSPPAPPLRHNNYPHYEIRQTRWNDTDGFGHVNNSVYYNYMDDAINVHLIERGIGRNYPRFIAENGIQFYKPIQFPSQVRVGLRVVKLGSSSVTYDVGFYILNDDDKTDDLLVARGKFVHVYVDESTGRPTTIPEEVRRVLQQLLEVSDDEEEVDYST